MVQAVTQQSDFPIVQQDNSICTKALRVQTPVKWILSFSYLTCAWSLLEIYFTSLLVLSFIPY